MSQSILKSNLATESLGLTPAFPAPAMISVTESHLESTTESANITTESVNKIDNGNRTLSNSSCGDGQPVERPVGGAVVVDFRKVMERYLRCRIPTQKVNKG